VTEEGKVSGMKEEKKKEEKKKEKKKKKKEKRCTHVTRHRLRWVVPDTPK